MKRKGLMVWLALLMLASSYEVIGEPSKTVNVGEKIILFSSTFSSHNFFNCIWFKDESPYPVFLWANWEFSSIDKIYEMNSGGGSELGDGFCFINRNLSYGSDAREWRIYANVPHDAEEGTYQVRFKVVSAKANQKIFNPSELDFSTFSQDIDEYSIELNIINPKRIEAESKIAEVEGEIDEANSEGIKISDLESQFRLAKNKMQYKQYTEIINSMISIKSDISFRRSMYYLGKKRIEVATSGINELDKMLFASTEDIVGLLDKAEAVFDEGNYIEANEFALRAIKEIEAEKLWAEERKSNFLKGTGILIIVILIIGIVIWRNKTKSKSRESIPESISPISERSKIEESKEDMKKREEKKDIALRKLAKQYADGEITREEYERLKRTLEDVM